MQNRISQNLEGLGTRSASTTQTTRKCWAYCPSIESATLDLIVALLSAQISCHALQRTMIFVPGPTPSPAPSAAPGAGCNPNPNDGSSPHTWDL